ncbi:MAG: citrate (Si)-synthase, partial [Microbacteriaceae bacterium]
MARLEYPGGSAEFPIVDAVIGPDAIDVSSLSKQTGLNTFDRGFVNTASTTSAITFIDGDKGILRY